MRSDHVCLFFFSALTFVINTDIALLYEKKHCEQKSIYTWFAENTDTKSSKTDQRTSKQLSGILSKYHLFCIWKGKMNDFQKENTLTQRTFALCWRKQNGDNMKHPIVASPSTVSTTWTQLDSIFHHHKQARSCSALSTSTSPVVALCPLCVVTKGTKSIWCFQNCPAHVRGWMIQRGTCAETESAVV